jgi:hypothetical protein
MSKFRGKRLQLQEEIVMTEDLLDLPPRGLALLHACQPQARKQVEVLSDIVMASGLRRPAMNILCNGDFGWDADYLTTLVRKYSQGGRVAQVVFYLTNGPAARHRQTQVMDGFASRTAPEQFRRLILTDRQFQQEYQALVWRLADLVAEIHQAGGQALIVPQLEDNQTDRSFAMMLELTRSALPQDLAIRYGRNPCVGCYPGNEGGLPAGCFLEEHHHSADIDFTLQDGILSNDGCTCAFTDETPAYTPWLPLENFAGVQGRTGLMNSIFLLWNAKYQGLDRTALPPAKRKYVMPTENERAFLIEFLRKPVGNGR